MAKSKRIMASQPMQYRRPEERPNGPWDDGDLDDVGHHLIRTNRIKKHGKLMKAVQAHAKKKAAELKAATTK